MNKKIITLLVGIVIGITLGLSFFTYNIDNSTHTEAPNAEPESEYNTELASLNLQEARTRSSTVKVISPSGGHGSGNLYYFQEKYVVFTAGHVAQESGTYTLIDEWGEEKAAKVIYVDSKYDFGILSTTRFEKTRPLSLRLPHYNVKKSIDKGLIFSGYPSSLPLLTNRGSIAGFHDEAIIMHSAAWMGSSGSNVFDNSGNFIGIVYAISVGNFVGIPALMEDVVWIVPHYLLDWKNIRKIVKEQE
jgi:hypothetical protein